MCQVVFVIEYFPNQGVTFSNKATPYRCELEYIDVGDTLAVCAVTC